MANRRGFTLVELVVAIVLLSIVGTVLTRMLTGSQRLARFQSAQAVLQSNVRAGAALVPSELREVGISATASDIMTMTPTEISYRAMRSTGVACVATATTVTLRNRLLFGYRPPVGPRDALLIFMDDNVDLTSDDSWGSFPITGAGVASLCPDGQAGTLFAVPIGALLAKIRPEAPVRTYEVMELGLFTLDGKTWLGARSSSAGETALQPVLGPLKADGLELKYLMADGVTVTAQPLLVRSIAVTLRGLSDNLVSSGPGPLRLSEDSLVARVRLRNAP